MANLLEIVAPFAVDYLQTPLKKAVKSVMEVPKDVADMKDKLDGIQAIIHDVDKMAAAEEGNSHDGLKAKLKQLVETSFCMEDIVDECMIHEEKQLGDDPGCKALPCKAIDFVKTTASRLQFAYMNEDVKSEFRGIKERNGSEDSYQIQSSGGNQNITFHNLRMAPLYLKEAEVLGFDGPGDTLEKWLKEGREERTVISVVGMGGLGKTTLVKKVFDKKKKKEGIILQWILTDEVRNHLRHKRYVVVFDDVWNTLFWQEMEFALIDDENGSRILITSRNQDVVNSCKRSAAIQVHELQPLTLEKSLELFYTKAFGSDFNGRCPSNLKDISTEIVKKCQGLPLAIVVIGGLLFDKKREILKWQRFYQNLSCELRKNPSLNPVKRILGFSYHDLPYNLKPCFLYFGIYPEDYKVERGTLILQWIAEGFVKSEATETLEEVAEKYFNELIKRSLVQVSSFTKGGKIKYCGVHDLVYEIIREKNEDLSFCHSASERENSPRSGMIRRLTIASDSNNLVGSVGNSNIRSLHVFSDEELSESSVKRMPTNYRLLRVLHFERNSLYNYVPLTENFGDLSLLTYLSFRNSKIVDLPKSIGVLHNLETLDLRESRVLVMPREFCKLKKLRHLLGFRLPIEGSIGDLTSLETLCEVKANHDTEEVMKGLERLTQLRVLGLTLVPSHHKSSLCSLINKMQRLDKLYITTPRSLLRRIDLQFDVCAPVLQKVRIVGGLKEFPNWVAKLPNLVTLSLTRTRLTVDPLPLLTDLPYLSSLFINRSAYDGEVLQFPNRGFQNLKQILLNRLYGLKSIVIEDGALPSLEKFKLVRILELKEVPSGLYKLPNLEVFHAIHMSPEFQENFNLNRGQRQWIIE
ncbi:Disease resistance protein RPM1 [Glycine soja]|uniref:Disease resistance protein RPM1 n=1 Tax=Glycine soja TaxID=3848 RepID=A0A0B2QE41_GLYSO|nr:Disease resistance protein RPM1 [Glycine soja]